MRNLWLFISKYNAFFFFIIFLVISIVLFVQNNSFQRASVLNSSNQMIGQGYETVSSLENYLNLKNVNDSLAREIARLKSQQTNAFYDDSVQQKAVTDSINKQQYFYIVAEVVNNSIHLRDNIITINRGKKHGIERGMGVICPSGVVGIVNNVSKNYATVRSLLHSEIKISASIKENNAFGSLVWGEENYDPRKAILKDIPNHVEIKKGQHVITSGYSTLFPRGLPIGRIIRPDKKGGQSFLDIEVGLNTDFTTLQYVYVIRNIMSLEQTQLETPAIQK